MHFDPLSFTLGMVLTAWAILVHAVSRIVVAVVLKRYRIQKHQKAFQEAVNASATRTWEIPPEKDEEAILGAIRRPIRPESAPFGAAADLPQFGMPEVVVYDPQDYIEPLRCSVARYCDGRGFTTGERFMRIPLRNSRSGEFLALCSQDIVMMEPA